MIKIINGKKYEVARGGCCSCAFNSDESEDDYCAYAEEVGGVLQFKCKLKFGEHYEEVRDAD
jgi:hypothetical protein